MVAIAGNHEISKAVSIGGLLNGADAGGEDHQRILGAQNDSKTGPIFKDDSQWVTLA